jgi:predicted nuclease of predicted toxin-antitoxin system
MPALVVNENFPAPSTVVLRTAGLDVLAIGEAHPGMNDRDVLALACLQSRWLLTFDTDYAELVFHRYLPPPSAILLIRATRYRADEPAQWVLPLTQTPSDIQGFFLRCFARWPAQASLFGRRTHHTSGRRERLTLRFGSNQGLLPRATPEHALRNHA